MHQLSAVQWIEVVGWAASLLTIATYAMNTMIPLRLFAISSSIAFMAYAFFLQLWPLLVMELILLPINVYRFLQIFSLRGRVLRATESSDADFSVIKRYGKRRRMDVGTVIFERGDPVDQLYFLSDGRVRIEEFGIEMAAGDIFGEIAFFTDAATRTATARCLEDVEVFELDRKRFMRLQFEDPSFGLAVMRTVTRRLARNGLAGLGTPATDPQPAS